MFFFYARHRVTHAQQNKRIPTSRARVRYFRAYKCAAQNRYYIALQYYDTSARCSNCVKRRFLFCFLFFVAPTSARRFEIKLLFREHHIRARINDRSRYNNYYV